MRYATLRKDTTLYNARYSSLGDDDFVVIPSGTIVETVPWDWNRVSVWVDTYNGLCDKADVDFLE